MRRSFGFICLGILSCALANATPIFEFNTDTTPEFTESLPFLKWIGPDIWPKEKPFDFDGFDSACPVTSAKFVNCFFKFFWDNDPPPSGDWFGHDPLPNTDPPGDPVTPEPPAWTLLGAGLASLALFRHKLAA